RSRRRDLRTRAPRTPIREHERRLRGMGVLLRPRGRRTRVTDALTPAEFAAAGHDVIDWIARYLREIDQYPVLSRVAPGDVRSQLPSSPPTAPATWSEIFADFEQVVMPGVTHWNHPGFFAYFANTASSPGILAEMLIAA